MPNTLDRFIEKTKVCDLSNPDSCWVWTACINQSGYGMFWHETKMELAHRVSFSLFKKENTEGLCVLHKCDNRICVNPEHLFLGTNLDNMKDRNQKGRTACGERVGNSKLTDIQVREIRSLRNKLSQVELGKRYNISTRHIRDLQQHLSRKSA